MTVREEIIQKLLEVNRKFYTDFATSFSATRKRLQPGVRRILDLLPAEGNLLDLGCGNGEVWQELARRGYRGQYIGLDVSPALLHLARQSARRIEPANSALQPPLFLEADLGSPGWSQCLPALQHPFHNILAFATLHHLPGATLRRKVLSEIHQLLSVHGTLIHSEWQFLNSPRLQQRIQPWEEIGLKESEVEAGDYLLDWRREGRGLRYVHHFHYDELASLAEECGFEIINSFLSDGEGGRLSLYQVWKSVHQPMSAD